MTALVAALLAGLAAFPSCIAERREAARLRARIADLQARIHALEAAAAQAAARDDGPAEPAAGAVPAAEEASGAAPPAPSLPRPEGRPPPATAGDSAGTTEEALALAAALTLHPAGLRTTATAGSNGAPVSAASLDPLARQLVNGYALLQRGCRQDAARVFRAILAAHPDWPYGCFYLAVATGEREPMERAAHLFARAEKLGVLPPEGTVYLALTLLFTGDHDGARSRLASLAGQAAGQRLSLGPLCVPRSLPADIRQQLGELAPLDTPIVADWPRGPAGPPASAAPAH